MNPMRTPFRLLFLAFLGACTSGAATSGPQEASYAPDQATPTEVSPRNLDSSQEPTTQEPEASDGNTAQAQLPTEADAFALKAHVDYRSALSLYAQLMQDNLAAQALARAPKDPDAAPDPAELARLQAELEWLALGAEEVLGASRHHPEAKAVLAAVELDESHGLAWSVFRHWRAGTNETLGRLTAWQFLGPFDNERGAAMDAPIAPEADPASNVTHQGKVRSVQWRATPEAAPAFGILDFDDLLRPAQQSAVLLRTWIASDADREAVLLLGVDGEFKLWHDGASMVEAKGRHHLSHDGHAIPLQLHAGWNEIAIKLGSRDHAPRLTARLVDPQAAPLRLEHTHTPPPEILPQTLAAEAGAAPALEDHPSAMGYYAKLLQETPDDAQATYRLAYLQRTFDSIPVEEHPGRAFARKAVELAPDVARYRSFYARTLYPSRGSTSAEVDLNPCLEQVRLVLADQPWNPDALILRAGAAAVFQKLEPQALEAIDRFVEACDARPLSLAHRAQVLGTLELDTLERNDYFAMLQHPDVSYYPSLLQRGARAIFPSGSPDRLAMLEEAHRLRPDAATVLRDLLRERRFKRSDFDAHLVLAELEMQLALDPWNSGLLRTCAERFQSQGDLDTAFQLVQQALALKPESPRSLALLARLHLDAGNLEEAVATLERELEIDYSAEDESRLLEHLRALDGASFEQPYREDLAAILARHGERNAEQDAADHSHEYLLYRSVIRLNPDSTADRYYRKVIRVLNPNGVRRLDVVGFPYSYGDEDLRVESVTVTHPDGSVENARTARGWRGRSVDLPQLQVGDIIDMEWRVDDLRTTYFGKYFGLDHAMTPDRSVPTRESQLVLLVPEELPLKFHTKRLEGVDAEVAETERFGTSHSWTTFDLAPERIESFMPHAAETVARVQASSYASWDDFGAWWWNLIEDGITVSPEMREKVAELVEGKATLRDQVSAIYTFVANDIRYNAWEFGVHGYQPYTAPVIFSRKFGDCKDKGILLRAMLSEIGVEAYPVLILRTADGRHGGRRFEEDLELAMVNHFNHCIAYIPPQGDLPGWFVDGTARLHPMEVLPYDDRGAQVLIVKPDGIERVRIPFSDAADNTKAETYLVSYAADGAAEVQMILQPTGRFDPEYRNAFAGGDQERADVVERYLSGLLGPLEGDATYDIPDVENLEDSLTILLGGKVNGLSREVEGGLEIPFMLNRQGLLQGIASESERTTDLLLDAPHVRAVTYEFTLPAGYTLQDLPEAIDAQTEDAIYRWEMQQLGDATFRVSERFEMLTHRVPLARYQAFRDLCRLIDSNQDRFFGVTAPPPPPPTEPEDVEIPEEEVVEDQQ